MEELVWIPWAHSSLMERPERRQPVEYNTFAMSFVGGFLASHPSQGRLIVGDFVRRWLLDAPWRLQVEENAEGWTIREVESGIAEGDRPLRWSDASGAFGGASDEFRLEGRSGVWDLRVFSKARVVSSGPVPGGTLRRPAGWWMDSTGQEAGRNLGFGAQGTSVEALERCERRGWDAGLSEFDSDAPTNTRFSILSGWHRRDDAHGDTAVLHRLAPIEGEASLRERLRSGSAGRIRWALDCRALIEDEDTEDALADAFLFAHQAFGARWLCWDAPPSALVVRALERAHMDAQGELFGVWLAGPEAIPARSAWRRLGPVLKPSESEPDCYVWER